MEYTVRQKEKPATSVIPDMYEFDVVKEATTPEGTKIMIIDRIETYTLEELENKKTMLLNQIADIDAKIAAINKIKK